MQRRLILYSFLALFFIAGILPVLSLITSSLFKDGVFDLSQFEAIYKNIFLHGTAFSLLKNTFLLSSSVTVISVIIGVTMGIIFEKTDSCCSKLFIFIFAMPLFVPPYITAVSWHMLTGINGFAGSVLVLSSSYIAIPLFITIFFLKSVDPALEQAALVSSSWFRVIAKITLPLIMPGVAASAVIVFLLTSGEITVPSFLGYNVFALESFTAFTASYDFKAATILALPLIGFPFILFLLEFYLYKNLKSTAFKNLTAFKNKLKIKLKKNKILLLSSVVSAGFTIAVLPVLILIINAKTLSNYKAAFTLAGNTLLRSIFYSIAGATMLTVTGFFLGYMVNSKKEKLWPIADFGSLFLFTLPGSVTAIGLIGLWNRPETLFIYSSFLIIIIGYTAKYSAVTIRIISAWLSTISSTVNDAAKLSGAGWIRTITFITAPLSAKGIAVAWIAGYLFSLRDTTITMMVYPPGHDTLPVRILTLMANGQPEIIAALCIIMIAAATIPVFMLWIIFKLIQKEKL